MDPTKQLIDQTLLIIGLAAYIVGTLVLGGYFLTQRRVLRTIGIPLAAIGCVAQFIELATRWNMTGVWPLTNLYGSLSLFSAMSVLLFIIFAARYNLWFLGAGVLGLAAIALGYATTWNEGAMPAVPALQSYWIKIHVPLVVTAYASFSLAFVISLAYLLKATAERRFARHAGNEERPATANASIILGTPTPKQDNVASDTRLERAQADTATPHGAAGYVRIDAIRRDTPAIAAAAERGDPWARWLAGLPALAQLDVITYRVVAVGLPLLTLGIITGAWWAKEAWGAYWQWDPKETAALVSWICYASYMHLHTRRAWRGTRSAIVCIGGYATIVFCYLGVNIWISGLHSYARSMGAG